VTNRIPTRVGDVLILTTNKSYRVHVVGLVSKDGQQDFRHQEGMTYASTLANALVDAKALLVPGRRIFLLDVDTRVWTKISD
jgi:hypothetical protein